MSAGNGGGMSYTKKPLMELDVMDDFLINAVACDREVGIPFCRRVLSVLLQRKIGAVRVVSQRVIPPMTPDRRGIRMDVEIEELDVESAAESGEELPALRIYDMEPHIPKDEDMLKHNRFYQAKIDSRYPQSGDWSFKRMPELYVLTVTNYDPFGYDYMMYTVENSCREVPELAYEDGLHFVYFNTEGSKGGNGEIKAMLNYFRHSRAENAIDEATEEIHRYISKVKTKPEMEMEYMKFDEIIHYAKEEGYQLGREEGIQIAKIESIYELLEDYGEVTEPLKKRLEKEMTPDKLKNWLKLAARCSSIEEFEERM